MDLTLNLRQYDHFSFDLDNTICVYNIDYYYTTQCQYLFNYLHKVKQYITLNPVVKVDDISFISRGLFIDYENGNLLKLDKDGVIVRASHGTKMLTNDRIAQIYGSDSKWNLFKYILADPIKLTRKSYVKRIMSLMDFTNASISVVYGKAIDAAKTAGKPISQVKTDLNDAIHSMHSANSICSISFFSHLNNYVYKQNVNVLQWLKALKSIGYTSLITSSNEVFAQRVAAQALGYNWKELFDFIVYSSKKPHFFIRTHPFQSPVFTKTKFTLEGEYSGGSFDQIESALAEKLGRKSRSLYFGDSPINDLIASPESVSIIEEFAAENLIPHFPSHRKFLTSSQWGSLFYENNVPTWFGNIVLNTKFCAPSLGYFSTSCNNFQYNHNWQK